MQWSITVFVCSIDMDSFIALPAACLREEFNQSLLDSDVLLAVSDDEMED